MSSMQRRKGAYGERELAELLRTLGVAAERSARNGVDRAEDVMHALVGVHIECKRVERLDLPGAMRQAIQAAGRKVPTVWHRRSREPWLVTLRAEDLPVFCAVWEEATNG